MRFHVDELDLRPIGLFTIVTNEDLGMRGDGELSGPARETDVRE